MWSSYALSQKF